MNHHFAMRTAWPRSLTAVTSAAPIGTGDQRRFLCYATADAIPSGFGIPVHEIKKQAPWAGQRRTCAVFKSPEVMRDWADGAVVRKEITQAQHEHLLELLGPYVDRPTADDVLPPAKEWIDSDYHVTLAKYDLELLRASTNARERTQGAYNPAATLREMMGRRKIGAFRVVLCPALGTFAIAEEPLAAPGMEALVECIKTRHRIDKLPPDPIADAEDLNCTIMACGGELSDKLRKRYTKKTKKRPAPGPSDDVKRVSPVATPASPEDPTVA